MVRHSIWSAASGLRRGLLGMVILLTIAAGCAPVAATPAAQPAAPAAPVAAPTTVAPAATEAPAPQVLPATGTTPEATAASATAGTLVNLARVANFGLFLTDDKGMTLYLYTKDTPNTSNCYDQCATAWPPLLTEGTPAAGAGVTASLLGTTTRTDGKMQVTYKGNPLYYFVKDKQAGDITGQGVGGVWFVVSPRGTGMTGAKVPGAAPTPAAPAPTPAPSGGGGYGYGGGGYGNGG